MSLINTLVPAIRVSPASPEQSYPQPYSPFPPTLDIQDDDGFRASRLSVPHSGSRSPWHPSPLRPATGSCPSRPGLSRDQFDSLLKVSREQRAALKTQKVPDLRKELALKNQSLKQAERRAHFLSRIKVTPTISDCAPNLASPSVDRAISVPGSPFHVLGSSESREEFGDSDLDSPIQPATPSLPTVVNAAKKARRGVPSLEEIAARLKLAESVQRDASQPRLPSFRKPLASPTCSSVDAQIKTISVRTLAVNDEKFDLNPIQGHAPELSRALKIQLTTPLAPFVVNLTPASLNQSTQRPGRAIAAQGMMATLKRRHSPPPGLENACNGQTGPQLRRRLSSPARLTFDRAALSPGAF